MRGVMDCSRYETRVLAPPVTIRVAGDRERARAQPWCLSSGEDSFEVVEDSDGGNTHAPEVIAALQAIFAGQPRPSLLIFVHRGQRIDCMMPLLPSLLNAVGYRGPCCAIRIGDSSRHSVALIDRFVRGQLPDNGFAIIVEDRQERIGPVGSLVADRVEISFLEPGNCARPAGTLMETEGLGK
jgi:hypothetical protein